MSTSYSRDSGRQIEMIPLTDVNVLVVYRCIITWHRVPEAYRLASGIGIKKKRWTNVCTRGNVRIVLLTAGTNSVFGSDNDKREFWSVSQILT